jgi:hypothetical protein
VWSHVLDVDVRSKPDVISQVPAVVVGVLVNRDIVAIPEPVVAEADVEIGNGEAKTTEPEQARASAAQMPHMAAAEAAGEASMFPGMIEMIVSIIPARFVANPFAVGMNVGSVGMPRFVVVVLTTLGHRMGSARRSGTVRGGVPAATARMTTMLSNGRERK